MKRTRALLLLLLLLAPTGSGLEPLDFADETLRLRYQHLAAELRCPKCSNQSLRDSDAPVAMDLRQALHRLLHEGRSDDEILAFMSERYGEFIRYRPRFSSSAPLWLAPLLLGGAGLLLLLRYYRRRGRNAARGEQTTSAATGEAIPPGPPGSGHRPTGTNPSPPCRLLGILLLAAILGSLALYEGLGARRDWQLTRQLEGEPDWNTLAPLLESRHQSNPERSEYMVLLAKSRLQTGQYRGAAEMYRSLSERMPEEKTWLRMAALAEILAEAAEQQEK